MFAWLSSISNLKWSCCTIKLCHLPLYNKLKIIKVLSSLLTDIDIAHKTAVCHDYMSSIHKQDTCAYHDAIIMAMIQAYSETISTSKSGCSNIKYVTGWNEYIE